MVTAIKFQFHIIARLDDICHFEEVDLCASNQFSFALNAWICWSKNIVEEREAPTQTLLGSMDINYCVLLGLGIYLEAWMEQGRGVANNFLFGDADNPQNTKNYVYKTLTTVWSSDNFVPHAG
jgi:hypothetical protein